MIGESRELMKCLSLQLSLAVELQGVHLRLDHLGPPPLSHYQWKEFFPTFSEE